MDKKDELKGKLKEVAGRAERKLGEVTGNKKTEARGIAREAEGKMQQTIAKAKDATKPLKKKAA